MGCDVVERENMGHEYNEGVVVTETVTPLAGLFNDIMRVPISLFWHCWVAMVVIRRCWGFTHHG
jgi:hypothetical protein